MNDPIIDQCRLPPGVIKRLGLEFAKSNSRRVFDKVPFDYASPEEKYKSLHDPPDPDDLGSDNDEDECEEWERHEALNDDVTSQDRTKPRLYEEELEVVWEKGGPGLVFYTDDFLWDQMDGKDSEERWTDDWDVDMSVYYSRTAGDKDARDHMQIREEEQIFSGQSLSSVFAKKSSNKNGGFSGRKRARSASPVAFGAFEAHTKGIGRKVLEKQGWKEGQGLGLSYPGKPYPVALDLEEEGQSGRSKKGFGYRGQKLQRFGLARPKQTHKITTVFDNVKEIDKKQSVHRSQEDTRNKNRDVILPKMTFVKRTDRS